MRIYERIKQDHDELRAQMKRIEEAEPESRRDLFDSFKILLWSHARVEEVVFYAPLRGSDETRKEVLEGLNEHHLGDALLDELEAMTASTEAWAAKFQVLREITEHHLDEEEEELFEMARKVLDDHEAEFLGQEFDRRRDAVAEALAPVASKAA
ncbi:hemerythrin domain-containing protein [Arenibaculum pallidiluteum]|uniref:hemerythrin domain-containing protein n=1 Tax=Arenibaculum pallidiluteum TaxID=2812559 RepID=UPI001A95F03B|nr:hemerythrin domain-containing protein [Arenibaculum pallidiluteum]